ncbi:flavin-containing monooxygenase 5-like isoform X6 [Dermacentor silvarum]|uniref:flavin-containing monooxygenase 5-like isoform X6 n=1 Tax=Dermacentor silvarum TaxID=543639 RepID=UPI002101A53A|nr:flavin-containing monooxygenase 5-like isoform X6 [Dermacentor silvarum]
MSKKKVCIVGAGSSGLTCARQMLDYGFDVVLYERSPDIGGLWAYHDDDVEGRASVMRTTIINTSKEMSAFSDFPPPKDLPNYMHNTKMLGYFRSYADHFGVTKHVKTRHDVVQVTPAADYEKTGRWDVLVRDLEANTDRTETYDGVAVCVGHHVYPNVPHFKGQEKFRGRIVHTHSLKNADTFRDRRVAVVGIGNSAVDAVVDASYVALETYLSTRRGAWVAKRVGPNGMPIDIFLATRLKNYMMRALPESVTNDYVENILNGFFNHEVYGLKPKHRYNAQHPTVNDALPNLILSGKVRVKKDIVEFTEDGVLFEGDDKATLLDDVILATGYQIKFPFLPKDVLSVVDNQVQLYKYVFPPHLKHPSLAMIGLIQPIGAIFPIAELQSRWMAELLSEKRSLPSEEAMFENIRKKREHMRRRYVASPRHTIQVDWINYMDELASQIGARPNILKYFFTDNELFRALLGPCVPYQFRLEGPHPWPGARQAILNSPYRVMYPLNDRCTSFERKNKGPSAFLCLFLFFFVLAVACVLSGLQQHS